MLLNTAVKAIKRKSHRGTQAVTSDQITLDIIACINEAMRDVVKLLPKRFWFKQGSIAVVAGVAGTPAVYSLPSDCQEPIILHYTTSNQLYQMMKIDSDKEWIRGVWNPAQSTQRPMYYREIGPDTNGYKQIEIFPISDASYTMKIEYYKVKGTDLTVSDLSTAIPDVPDYCLDVIEKGGLYYFIKGFDDPGGPAAKMDYYEAKQALEMADERDADSDLTLRLVRPSFLYPGFRQDR